ncbi:MAG: hypothetical protein K6U03_07650 [Firmicutes bacterium]|nr:hypothetical protein [Bacillota bacterium]
MKKRFPLRSLLVVFAILAALQATAVDTYQIALRFRTGEVRRYNFEETLLLKFQAPGQGTLEFKTAIRGVLRQEVLRVDPDGTAEMACRMESWQRRNWANGSEVASDPKESETILGLRLRLKVSPNGAVQILEPAKMPESIPLEAYADYSFLPARPVAVGEEWTKSFNLDIGGVDCPTTVRNRLEKVETIGNTRVAKIGQELRQEVSEFSVPLEESFVGRATAAGTFIGVGAISFDLERGSPKEGASLFQGRLVAKIQTGEARMEMPMEMELSAMSTLLP